MTGSALDEFPEALLRSLVPALRRIAVRGVVGGLEQTALNVAPALGIAAAPGMILPTAARTGPRRSSGGRAPSGG
ncbi:hypothetical protein M4V62_02290 [Streptomyces durmitorensis]|uniref:Uncharacterized protein n=1 Tax=Streptomyces durmitorensis TaxID=319947 RepID=A0ABY4PM09_9ACTN|nr:hypothetical protein [Streptomyces durmitorensis]UQT53998.1 hypothetical protein M4V62_02290 [Streptomyces durmitorensis]